MHTYVFLTAVLLSLISTISMASLVLETADTVPTLRRLFAVQRSNPNPVEDDHVTPPLTAEVTDALPTVYRLITERLGRIYNFSWDDDRTGRNFPEVDERGFDEDIFDEGFGEWEPLRF